MKATFTEQQETGNRKRGGRWKIAIFAIIVLIGIFAAGLSFVGYKTYEAETEDGYKSPYDLAYDFVTYTYQGDTESIFRMQPRPFQARSIEDNQVTYALDEDDVETPIANLKQPLADYMELLGNQHGQWTETHETVQDMYTYTDEELDALLIELKMQGVDEEYLKTMNGAAIVDVNVDLEASNGSGGWEHTVHVPVYKCGSRWYLGQRTGDVFLAMSEGEHDPYGDLLDGFHVTGKWDGDGNRVIENEDGYRVYTDEESGREYYEDEYGNKCYYDEAGHEGGKIMEVTGPDGGEALTADTWEDWWNNYYEEQGFDVYPDYQYDEWGNTQYLDEDGNVTETVGPDGGKPLTEETYEEYWDAHGGIEEMYSGQVSQNDITE